MTSGPTAASMAGGALRIQGYDVMGARKERKKFKEFIEASIASRSAWASSEDGRRVLGPGSPAVPGLQDLHFILEWLNARDTKRKRSQ